MTRHHYLPDRWSDDRPAWAAKHRRCNAALDTALARAVVTAPADDVWHECGCGADETCPLCRGSGGFVEEAVT